VDRTIKAALAAARARPEAEAAEAAEALMVGADKAAVKTEARVAAVSKGVAARVAIVVAA
jgi:hypothetical protein